MNDERIRAQIQQAVDHHARHLRPDPLLAQRIMRMERMRKMHAKRKTMVICALILALMLLSATAYAVTRTLLSSRVDAKRLANQALEEKYGLTPAMLGFFMQDVQGGDHNWRVTYEASDEVVADKLGHYLVLVKNGAVAEITWSLEDENTQGGFDAVAWGAPQLAEMVKITSKTHDYSRFRAKAQGADVNLYAGMDVIDETALSEEVVESVLDDPEEVALLQAERKLLEEAGKASAAQAKFTRAELVELGRQGIILAYQLDYDQQQRLQLMDDLFYVPYYSTIGLDERPTFHMTFQAWSDGGWQAGDGVYTVVVNVLNGTVEYLDYDTTLDGNG